MKSKINLRLIRIAIVAVISTVIGITSVYYGIFQKQIRKDLSVSAKLLKDTHYFESVNIDTDEIDLSANISELRVTWIANDGTVLYDNDNRANTLANHNDRPEIIEAFKAGEGQAIRKSDTMKKNTFYYAVLLDNGTVLRVATEAQSMWSVFISASPVIGRITALIIGICVVISHMLTERLIRPVEMMAENLDNTDYDAPYKELSPIQNKLRSQHIDILSAAKARQDFTANVSHELKTPLTAISGYAELLENDMVDESQHKHFYREIKRNSERLLTLINDIIRLSELDSKDNLPAFDNIDLYMVVKECMDDISVSAKHSGITASLEGESHFVQGNADMLKEMVENLAANAIKYNNSGGNVIIRVTEKNGRTILLVKDDGIGIPASEQKRIFERFYRVDKSRSKASGGTGLGLAIVKHIAEIHDARIEVDSALNVGTTVTVTF